MLIGLVVGLVAFTGTTDVAAVVHAYDGPTTTRVDEHHIAVTEAGTGLFSDPRDGSASPRGEVHGTSTTSSRSFVATNTVRPIGFAPGEGVSALTPGRLQHGTRHLTDAGVLPAWSGTNSPQLIRNTLSPILENPTATFNNTLGGTQVKGFIGTVNGQTVAVQVYAEGPLAGQLATAVVPTANQLTKWGVGP